MRKGTGYAAAFVLLCAALLTGCGNSAHYRKAERGAQRYYRDKYGGKETVTDSFKAGNSGLFGFIGVKDRAYEMSDGAMVYWNDSEEYYADNRQAEEITKALGEEVVEPAVLAAGEDVKVSSYSFNRTGMESFDEAVFTAFYDGDIRAYCKEEKIVLQDFTLVMREAGFKERAEAFREAVAPFLEKAFAELVVVKADQESGLPDPDQRSFRKNDPDVRAIAQFDLEKGLRWFESIYIEAAPGIEVCSDVSNFVLEPGDIRVEEWGRAKDLQAILDAGYEALPVDAEENKNGGYLKHDRRHEERMVLADPEAAVYRAVFSQRVREQIDEYGKVGFYILMNIPDLPEGVRLWEYDAKKSGDPDYRMWIAAENRAEKAQYHGVKEDGLFYVGEVSWEEYRD
ncbi:MAG: hypothetical protein IJG52_05035 [Lachnospiraceae bacterium]|nr:hypothetical protein [Lachnospiraceae bacterium]